MATVLLLSGLDVMPLVAAVLQAAIHSWPAYGALVAAYALTLLAIELLSNATAVALLLPIAANLAPGLQLPPMLLITAVVDAASQSFLSSIGYQTNLMDFGPGRYCFLYVLRNGQPLTLTYALTVPALVLCWGGYWS